MTMTPLIRLIVVNYNGGDMTVRCLESLLDVEWPPDRLEIVLVDNASTDGIADRVRRDLPRVRVMTSTTNRGFAGGANLGLAELDGVDYIGFVNNDAFPEPGWLHPLVAAFGRDRSIGAVAPKIVLAPRFVALRIESPTFRPGQQDPRELGVMVSGVRIGDADVMTTASFAAGFHGQERNAQGGSFQWTDGDGRLWVPFDPQDPPPRTVSVQLSSAAPSTATLSAGSATRVVDVGPDPSWHEVEVDGAPFDVINNAGSRLVAGGWAGDRGFMEPDVGQYDEPADVFAWCGAAALLSRPYLDDVGPFDDRLFLYYEDTDLSWRGRLRGWRYEFVPSSVVRHMHSATSGEGSALFNHYVDRNRLLVFLRNAPYPLVADAVWRFGVETARISWRDVVRPAIHRHPRQVVRARQKARSLSAFVRHALPVLVDRGRRRPTTDRRLVSAWAESP
jgi:GT2 family glycosyltransferase